jgi:DNA-binding transcriptional LysR family regulator
LATLKFAVLHGLGICVLPGYLCVPELRAGSMVQALPGWAPPPGVIHAVFPSRRGLAPAVRRFLDYLGEHVTREGIDCPL